MKKIYIISVIFLLAFFGLNQYQKVQKADNNKFSNVYSQRKSYVKGKIKKDSPNMFAEYYSQIKTELVSSKNNYPNNYLSYELSKASKNRSFSKKDGFIWKSIGPGNVGGRSRGIIIDPDDATANTWFVAAVGGGVWKTTNAGSTWSELTSEKGSLSASYMAMAPSNYNVIYLGTGEGFGNLDALGGQGIWKSTDKGVTWNQLPSTTAKSFGIINRIIVDPTNENILLVATSISNNSLDDGYKSGIYKSVDGGVIWSKEFESSHRVQQIISDPTNFDIQYASVRGDGVYKSINAGDDWIKSSVGFVADSRFEIAVSPTNPNKLYVSAANHLKDSEGVIYEMGQVFVSDDKAESWTKCSSDINFLGGQGWYNNAIIVDPFDENTFYVAGIGIYRIKYNGGNNIDETVLVDNYGYDGPVFNKGTHVDNHFFSVAKLGGSNYRLVVTNDGGICFTDNKGTTFNQPTSGFVTSQFYGIDKANGEKRYIGGMQDNSCYASPLNPNVASNWSNVFGGDGFDVVWNYEDNNKVMLSSQYNYIGVSHSGLDGFGDNTAWLADVDNQGDAPFFTKLAQSKQYPDLVVTHGANGIWKTEDFGVNWTNIEMPSAFFGTKSSHETKISLSDPSVVWSGISLRDEYSTYVSTDFGNTFSVVSSSTDVKGYLSGFATHPYDKNTAYALFSTAGNAKIMRTTDLGQNWEDISGISGGVSTKGFPDVAVFDLLVMPYDNNIIWVGTEIGIFETTDNAASWHMLNTEMLPASVYDLLIVNDEVIIGTHGRGVWTVIIPELSDHEPPAVSLPTGLSVSYLFKDLIQNASIELFYRNDYDNVKVYLNDELINEFTSVAKGDVEQFNNLIAVGENIIKVQSFIDGGILESRSKLIGLPLKDPSNVFVSDFNSMSSISEEFYGEDFSISQPEGFTSNAINSIHPYEENKASYLYLNTPIIINNAKSAFSYNDIAFVEYGEDGSSYPDDDFWDYVTVEGSTDGQNWKTLVTPYDADFDAEWKRKFLSSDDPNKNDYRNHYFSTLEEFKDGDVVLIRFKLFSDAYSTGWGWIIDDLVIQRDVLSNEDNFLSTQFKVYPNPVVNEYLYIESATGGIITGVKILDFTGKMLFSNNYSKVEKVILDVSIFSKGHYLLDVETDKGPFSKKIIVE